MTDASVPQPDIDALIEPQPAGSAEIDAWLERLRVAAEAALPLGFTLRVEVGDQTLEAPFELGAADWDPEEKRYTSALPLEVPFRGDARTVNPGTIAFSGGWLSVGLRGPLQDQIYCAIQDALSGDPSANLAVTVLELHRLVRLRSRVGESAIRNGGHDADIAEVQAEIAASPAE